MNNHIMSYRLRRFAVAAFDSLVVDLLFEH